MNRFPLVTIITPAYNRADLIAETIESVLSQNYPNLEYIVLDDGSSDATLDVIKRYDGRLRWESHPNMGEALTVNRGFSLAQGEILGVVNSDDPLLPNALRRLVEVLLDNPQVAVVYPDWFMIDNAGKCLAVINSPDFVSHADMVIGHHCLPGPGALFRRTVVEVVGGRNPDFRFVGDLDFWFRVGFVGTFKRVPEMLATFRVHDTSASFSCQNLQMATEHIEVVEKFFSQRSLDKKFLTQRSEAFLNAYHAAVCYCGKNTLYERIRFIIKSIESSPIVFLKRYLYRIFIYIALLCGIDYYNLRRTIINAINKFILVA